MFLKAIKKSRYFILKRCYTSGSAETVIVPNIDVTRPTIGRTRVEQEYLYAIKPDLPENPKLLKTSILGAPNAGKSTLVNRLLNRRISAVSSKVHTTRNRLTGVITENDTQIIFLDTPGVVPMEKKKKNHLSRQMIMDPRASLWDADLICVVHDISESNTRFKMDKEVLQCLYLHPEKESILILNKVDLLKQKKVLLDLVSQLTGGFINGQKLDIKYPKDDRKKFLDLESLYRRTAKKLNLRIKEEKTDDEKEILKLIDELKACEKILLDSGELTAEEEKPTTAIETLKSNAMTVEKFTGENDIVPYKTIDDITPFEYKQDLMNTTNWHLYYEKLSKLDLFVRDKKSWPYFNQVFMVSAKMNDGIDELKRYLLSRGKPGEWIFSRCFLTDQMPKDLAEMCVREKLLEILNEEIPYVLELETTYWNIDENDRLNVVINIFPRKKKFKRDSAALLSGGGHLIKQIANEARQEMMNTFQCEVSLKLIVVNSIDQIK